MGGMWQLAAKLAEQLDDVVVVNAPVRSIAQTPTARSPASRGSTTASSVDTVALVAISRRSDGPRRTWRGGHGHNAMTSTPSRTAPTRGRSVLFLGRLHPDKGVHLAIDAARAAGLPIVVAGKCCEPVELEYFRTPSSPGSAPT